MDDIEDDRLYSEALDLWMTMKMIGYTLRQVVDKI